MIEKQTDGSGSHIFTSSRPPSTPLSRRARAGDDDNFKIILQAALSTPDRRLSRTLSAHYYQGWKSPEFLSRHVVGSYEEKAGFCRVSSSEIWRKYGLDDFINVGRPVKPCVVYLNKLLR
ncbi:hypothetical protein Fcan01_09782 [Folsomia candida]|uniref:Uncharacterized protein n=1 Tax=Folsomia candida TaxID=158441 RepID=A0A226EEV4_FOLCA|nr:hypothetical protein Fcan01_09782 [Folsomia candida]